MKSSSQEMLDRMVPRSMPAPGKGMVRTMTLGHVWDWEGESAVEPARFVPRDCGKAECKVCGPEKWESEQEEE